MSLDEPSMERLLKGAFARTSAEGCARTKELAGYAAGELKGEGRDAFERHLAECRACREDLAQFGAVAPVWRRAVQRPRRSRPWLGLSIGSLAAAGAMALLWIGPHRDGGGLRSKGSAAAPQLFVAVKRGDSTFRAGPAARLQVGDQLGFFYSSSAAGHLSVHALTEKGDPVQLFPAGRAGSAPIRAGLEVPLPDGARVDAGSACEWIIGLFSERPQEAGDIARLLRQMLASRHGCDLGAARAPDTEVSIHEIRR